MVQPVIFRGVVHEGDAGEGIGGDDGVADAGEGNLEPLALA